MVDKINNYLFKEDPAFNKVLVPNKDTKTEISIELHREGEDDSLNSLSFIFMKDELNKHQLSNKEVENKNKSTYASLQSCASSSSW